MLTRLSKVGLLHRPDAEPLANVRRVKLDKGQELWIRFDAHRDDLQGYTAVEVVDTPRSDTAILAAMTAWLAQPIDLKRIPKATQYVLSGAYLADIEKLSKIGASLRKIKTSPDPVVPTLGPGRPCVMFCCANTHAYTQNGDGLAVELVVDESAGDRRWSAKREPGPQKQGTGGKGS
jgi:hypothetical protein